MIVLERYEDDFALLEVEGKIKKIPRDMLIGNIPEGSVLAETNGKYELDLAATNEQREKLADLQDSLFD